MYKCRRMLAQRLQEQAASAIHESQHELVQQFQANFEQYRLRTREEHMVTVSELQEQNDELQERLESAERAFEKSLQGHDTATPRVSRVRPPTCQSPSTLVLFLRLPRHLCSQCRTSFLLARGNCSIQ